MENLIIKPVGFVSAEEMAIKLDKAFIPALCELDGFSHIQVLWWFSECDNEKDRAQLIEEKPYKNGPEIMGTFATRSPCRPNPIAISCAQVVHIDFEEGVIYLAYIDANDNTPVLDIKPYTPSLDRVEQASMPSWCSHWPKSYEKSADFDWDEEFNF